MLPNPFSDDKNDLCPSLSYEYRLYGFIGCILISIFLSILSWVAVFQGNFVLFGIVFTMASLCSIGSSMFLAGPMTQVKRMFDEGRIIATGIYLVAMVLTVVAAVVVKSGPLVIVCCIIQYCAMIWYALSYIPFARTAVKKCFGSAIDIA
eukprot:GILI01002490.1.p1 GENE.GILI01002490.1~~GILI01002490.1.p1  ORF type:complete len:150 (-),score=22.23 GILI01002490.1:168-617(-)